MKKLTYSVLRVIDRFKMAVILSDIVAKCGATYIRKEGGYPSARAVTLEVQAPGGLRVDIRLDADALEPDVYQLSWYMAGNSQAALNPEAFSDANTYQPHKATTKVEGFEALCDRLEGVLMQAKEGTAYAVPSELAMA